MRIARFFLIPVFRIAKELNAKHFGGYTNWRLPTIEELCSLLEPIQNKRGQYTDELFAENISGCWSCDEQPRVGYRLAHVAYFGSGDVDVSSIRIPIGGTGSPRHFARAVRKMK